MCSVYAYEGVYCKELAPALAQMQIGMSKEELEELESIYITAQRRYCHCCWLQEKQAVP